MYVYKKASSSDYITLTVWNCRRFSQNKNKIKITRENEIEIGVCFVFRFMLFG